MSGTQAIYYRDRHGSQPVEEFIDRLPSSHQAAVDLAIEHRKAPTVGYRDRPDAMGRLQGPDGCAAAAASASSRR
jgi:hypothetical protein